MFVTTMQVEEDHEHAAEDVAEQDHSDAERNRDDAAAERNDRQRGQQDREKEEALVESGDVDRRGAGDTLADGDHELPHDGALDHRAHLRHVEIGDLLAERVEPPDEQQHLVPVGQQREEHVQEQDRRRDRAEHAARRTLQEAEQPLADLLRDRGHRILAVTPA